MHSTLVNHNFWGCLGGHSLRRLSVRGASERSEETHQFVGSTIQLSGRPDGTGPPKKGETVCVSSFWSRSCSLVLLPLDISSLCSGISTSSPLWDCWALAQSRQDRTHTGSCVHSQMTCTWELKIIQQWWKRDYGRLDNEDPNTIIQKE